MVLGLLSNATKGINGLDYLTPPFLQKSFPRLLKQLPVFLYLHLYANSLHDALSPLLRFPRRVNFPNEKSNRGS